jgi:hypothetical protein
MTNSELIRKADSAVRFLRECGSENGKEQADTIALLIQRLKLYESKLVHFSLSSSEILKDADIFRS